MCVSVSLCVDRSVVLAVRRRHAWGAGAVALRHRHDLVSRKGGGYLDISVASALCLFSFWWCYGRDVVGVGVGVVINKNLINICLIKLFSFSYVTVIVTVLSIPHT